jgi:hypothetical protein
MYCNNNTNSTYPLFRHALATSKHGRFALRESVIDFDLRE